MPLFACCHDGGGTDVQHARGLAHTTGFQRSIHDLLLDGPASLYASSKVRPRPARHARHRERGWPSGDRPCGTLALPWQEGQGNTWMILASLTRVDGSL